VPGCDAVTFPVGYFGTLSETIRRECQGDRWVIYPDFSLERLRKVAKAVLG
jgi:hypothetical protein